MKAIHPERSFHMSIVGSSHLSQMFKLFLHALFFLDLLVPVDLAPKFIS